MSLRAVIHDKASRDAAERRALVCEKAASIFRHLATTVRSDATVDDAQITRDAVAEVLMRLDRRLASKPD